MKRALAAGLLTLAVLPRPAAGTPLATEVRPPAAEIAAALPKDATVVVTEQADLTGDGLPELLVGYTLPRSGLPPTEGHTAVLERSSAGGYVRYDLEGVFPGHYHPRFTVRDLTGDGRPELIRENAGGAAWQSLSVFRRDPRGGYPALLDDPAVLHHLWDANGDGLPEVLRYERTFVPHQLGAGSIRWMGSRFVAWHSARWYEAAEGAPAGGRQPVADLTGLTLDQAMARTNRPIGLVIPVDSPAPAGQVVRQEPAPGAVDNEGGGSSKAGSSAPDLRPVHLAVSAGDVSVKAGPLPPIAAVSAIPDKWYDELGVPATSTAVQRQRWEAWLTPLIGQVRQTVRISHFGAPAYVVRLARPWAVTAGGKRLTVRYLGIPTGTPYLGLIFLAERGSDRSPIWPEYVAALYSPAVAPPVPLPAQPLRQYLQEQPGLEAFLTLEPASWYDALRLRGISDSGWPPEDPRPPLTGTPPADTPNVPDPDHLTVTVLNGYVRAARLDGDAFRVEVAAAPGRVHRWPLPLKGLTMGTNPVIHLSGPGGKALADPVRVPLSAWSGPPPGEGVTPGAPGKTGS
jgi:hypothetical protein